MLVTRPQPGADATAARVVQCGHRPVLAPMLRIETLRPALPDPANIQAVLIASANALAGLPARFRRVKLLCVGDATAAAADGAGFSDVHSANGDATALAALCGATCVPAAGPLLLAAGAAQDDRLADALHAHGFRTDRVVVYRAHPIAELPAGALAEWRGGTLGSALFLSAETARAFVHAIRAEPGPAGTIEALAIGAPAADILAVLPWRRVRVAVRPTQNAVLALLP